MVRLIRITMAVAAALLLLPLAAQALRPGASDQNPALRERIAERALRRGDRGQAVRELQQLLRTAGYDPGPADGVFGPLTEGAVLAVQAELNLGQDGLFGRLTLGALGAGASELAPLVAVPVAQAQPVAQALVFHTSDGVVLGTSFDVLAADKPTGRPATEPFALTFNGDPDPVLLPQILETLARHNMRATFFIQGDTALARPELVARIAEAGHELGNGGYEILDMSRLTGPMMQAQLRHTQKAIQAAAGQTPAHFRPPLGRAGVLLRSTASELQLRTTLWTNVTVTDPADTSSAELASRLVQTVYPGAVILLHQDRESTVAALDRFLHGARGQGYVSATLSDLEETSVQSASR